MRYSIILLLLAHSIPSVDIDTQKIFWGDANKFETPAEVDYAKIVYETPEYKSIDKNKVNHGTAKYWILISEANDHAIKVISEVGLKTSYDLITEVKYLGELDPPIKCDNITKLVLKKLEQGD